MENKDIKEVHVFSRGLEFPVIVYACGDRQTAMIRTFTPSVDTEGLCQWCITHGLSYKVIPPLKWNPVRQWRYKKLLSRLDLYGGAVRPAGRAL